MSNVQLFLLGMMVAWTPSLLLLAWVLWWEQPAEDEALVLEREPLVDSRERR
jgi:hypothetical protein